MKVPSNHKFSERKLIQLVNSGEFHISNNGEIWRMKAKTGQKKGGYVFYNVTPRRAERKTVIGYLSVRGMFNGIRHTGFAHRLVWQYFNGDIPDGMTINHKDGNKENNKLDNLEIATYTEQLIHRRDVLGIVWNQYGEKNNMAKLKPEDIFEIRRMRENGDSLNIIGDKFNVSCKTVSKIALRQRWKHI